MNRLALRNLLDHSKKYVWPSSRFGFATTGSAASQTASESISVNDNAASGKCEEESVANSAMSESVNRKEESVSKDRTSIGDFASQMPSSALSGPVIGRRFYKSAYAKAAAEGNGFVVMLDTRILKTPAKKILKVPSCSLAHAIAAEWEYQSPDGIRPFTMPLMRLASTVIDRVPLQREKIIQQLLGFFHTDQVCCREDEESALGELQVEVWDPLLDWVEQKFGVRPKPTSSIFVGEQPKKVVEAMEEALKSADDWQLAAIDALSAAAKSLVVSMSVVHGRLTIEEAVRAIRLEEDCQIADWGLVEGGHDIDIADLRVRVSSASVFLRLLSF